MIIRHTLTFLHDLNLHNDRTWFEENRGRYESTRQQFTDFVSQIIRKVGIFDSELDTLQPRDCMFRLNRDIRFSNDKRPYKTNYGAGFNAGGKKANTAGFYLHIEPGKSFAGGGLWMPPAEDLAKLRQEIDYNLADFESILKNKKFIVSFPEGLETYDMLKRPPKGYDADNPAIEYLKRKSFTVSRMLTDEEVIAPGFLKQLIGLYKSLYPFTSFLNEAIR